MWHGGRANSKRGLLEKWYAYTVVACRSSARQRPIVRGFTVRFNKAGLVLVVIFALGAITAAPAQASVLPELTVQTEFTGKGGKFQLKVEKEEKNNLTCTSSTFTSTPTNATLGTWKLQLSGCKMGAVGCRSLGDPAETILATGAYHLDRQASGVVVTLYEFNQLHYECGATLYRLQGIPLFRLTPLLTKTSKYELIANAKESKQEFTTFENNKGEKVTDEGIEVSMNSESFKRGAIADLEDKLTAAKETEIIKTE
jgi:hypothetical protein